MYIGKGGRQPLDMQVSPSVRAFEKSFPNDAKGVPKLHDVGLEKVWVHMQDLHRSPPVPYRIEVPLKFSHQLFDPYSTKPAMLR